MACVAFSVFPNANALALAGDGCMGLQSSSRRGATNIGFKPGVIVKAPNVSAAGSQALPAVETRGHMKNSRTLYEVLGLSRDASARDIKTAYRKLARKFHPDAAASSEEKSIGTEMFVQIHNAYAILSKPEDRAQYDRQLVMQQMQRWNRGDYRQPSRHVVRNWETDQCW